MQVPPTRPPGPGPRSARATLSVGTPRFSETGFQDGPKAFLRTNPELKIPNPNTHTHTHHRPGSYLIQTLCNIDKEIRSEIKGLLLNVDFQWGNRVSIPFNMVLTSFL